MSIAVFDVSEFQRVINWAAVVDPGVIRVHNGFRPDNYAQPNIKGARRSCPWRGWYQYLPAGVDPTKAAHDFQQTLGPTLPGEVMILDLEAGTGDQRARRAAWLAALQDPIEWTYSGLSFARTHLPGIAVDWIAAYQSNEPTDTHTLWQNTDARRFAGIATPCDGSIFNGTLAQLQALTNSGEDMTFTDADRSMLQTAYKLLQEQQLRNAPVVAAAVAGLPAATAKAVVAALPVTPGGSVDVAAIAKAVNDDAAKRLLS